MTSLDPFASARQVADTVLYEGYVLYPYRASSSKNQSRWQFGVLMPPRYVASDPSERDTCQTEVVLEAKREAVLTVLLRFLHVQHRTGGGQPDWDETVERQVEVVATIGELLDERQEHRFCFDGENIKEGTQRRTRTVSGAVVLTMRELPGPFGALRLTARVENRTDGEGPNIDRDSALQEAVVAAHTMYALDKGRFLSMTDPPEWARPEIAACRNEGTWPVLAESDTVVLSSPIILEDHPQIAPESAGDLYDATEIDEILTLRTMVLTDAEKAEARATDDRAAALIDRVDSLPQEHLERLHGAMRYLRHVTGEIEEPETFSTPGFEETVIRPDTPWWDPGADSSVSPETDALVINGVRVSRGSRVRLRPGARRTDAQDLFLRGRTATVEAVFHDVDGQQHLGVTPDDDAELAEIQRWHGRYLYFAPDEVEPLEAVHREPSR